VEGGAGEKSTTPGVTYLLAEKTVAEKNSYWKRKITEEFSLRSFLVWRSRLGGTKKENIGCLSVELLLFGVDFCGERLVGLVG